jgi:hypothetical protein
MKYSVVYLKPKKKGQFSKQSVVFLDVEMEEYGRISGM